MTSLLETIQSYIPSNLVASAASQLGESDVGISRALSGLIPTILSGVTDKASNDGALGGLFNALSDQTNTRFLDDLGGLLGGGNIARNDPKDIAGAFIGSLFGDKVGSILQAITSFAGLKSGSASSLLGMAGPLVMGALTKKIHGDGLNAAGLQKLLLGEKDMTRRAVPPQIANILSYPGAAQAARPATAARAPVAAASGRPAWLWAIPAVLGVGLVGWMLTRGGDKTEPEIAARDTAETAIVADARDAITQDVEIAAPDMTIAETETSDVETTAGDASDRMAGLAEGAADQVVDEVEGAIYSVTPVADYVRQLGDFELRGAGDGVEAKLVGFIDSTKEPCTDAECWFTFDRLTFNTGSAVLDMDQSSEQLTNIQKILEAYPDIQLKIGGYTDNTGADDLNMKLSEDRAKAVVAAVVAMGVAPERMVAEGYGAQHPVAPNDTEEGRAQNRRIDVRVRQR